MSFLITPTGTLGEACEVLEKIIQKFPSKHEMAKQTNRDFKLLLYFVSLAAQLIFESADIKSPVEIESAEADA